MGIRLELYAVATSYTDKLGRFHPAIMTPMGRFYWPNITKATEIEAMGQATLALADVQVGMDGVTQDWNIWRVE